MSVTPSLSIQSIRISTVLLRIPRAGRQDSATADTKEVEMKSNISHLLTLRRSPHDDFHPLTQQVNALANHPNLIDIDSAGLDRF